MEDYELKLYPITCECCDEEIPCPKCNNIFLRGWAAKERTLALCYDCGSVFWCDSGEIIETMKGNKENWGAKALVIVGSLLLER